MSLICVVTVVNDSLISFRLMFDDVVCFCSHSAVVHGFDLPGRDDRGAASIGIDPGLGAVVRPLEGHGVGEV